MPPIHAIRRFRRHRMPSRRSSKSRISNRCSQQNRTARRFSTQSQPSRRTPAEFGEGEPVHIAIVPLPH